MVTETKSKMPRILLVDDETAILNALGMFLEQEGYDVEAISRFNNYLSKVKQSELPDIIILDILLNQEDGSKIAKQLKKNPKTTGIPIIMISALPNGQELSNEAGAEAFLAKPFDINELNKTIERLTK